MVTIIDYGMGNLASIKNMLKKIGVQSEITSSIKHVENAKKLILPGVGAFDNAMTNINDLGLLPVLNKKVLEEKVPVLGICLGMQLLMDRSEEGRLPGLGWIKGDVKRFKFEATKGTAELKIPHMGWNRAITNDTNYLFKGLLEPRFYFVHSFYVACHDSNDVLATCNYGIEFVSSVKKGNILGTQFHPEKSHKFGMQLLKNFVELN